MIPGGDPYGWGVFSVPMPHEVRSADPAGLPFHRLMTRDIPWRTVGLSLLLTALVFLAAVWYGLQPPPEPLVRSEPPPVEVTVMLPPPAPLPPPVEAIAPQPPPAPKVRPKPPEPPVVRPEPPPPPVVKPQPPVVQPPPVPRPAPTPPVVQPQPPPEPRPLKQAPTEPLPQPAQLAKAVPQRQTRPAAELPQRQAEMNVATDTALPAAASVAAYQATPRTASAAALPRQTAAVGTVASATSLDVQPAVRRVARRARTQASLPQGTSASFSSAAAEPLAAVTTGPAQTRYEKSAEAAPLPTTSRLQAVATGRSGEPAVAAPQATGLQTDLAARPAAAPAMERGTVALAGSAGEEALSGPTAAVIQTATTAEAAPATAGSYDFLDLMGAGELDQSLMVSLNRLATCRDPGEESRLKTRLAALLSKPDLCRSGGVVFDIRNPESGYSIHIDLYNYAQREFRDRCDALELAVQACKARR